MFAIQQCIEYFTMNKNENYTELIELLNMIIEDDISIKELLSKKMKSDLILKEEIIRAIDEVSSDEIKKELKKKLENYRSERKKILMRKFGTLLFSDRIVRSTIDLEKNNSYKKIYSSFKKYY